MAAEHEEHAHPTPGEYVEIAVILAVITAIEVSLYFADIPIAITIPGLIVLTIIKFALVMLWFMHLRFDNKLFRRLFFVGIGLALVVFAVVIVMTVLGPDPGVGTA